MNEEEKRRLFGNGMVVGAFIMSVILLVAVCAVVMPHTFQNGYRAGQIDALEGKVKFHPTTQTVWEESE